MAIQRIELVDVHRITSGQVITDLMSAVKELLENALDSGATQIHLTFKNYGLDSLTVSDNGSGIRDEDFESLCLKHYTSKLSTFEDVESVSTLGFRGEAMSSLCGIASVSILTATKDASPKGWNLHYNHMGTLSTKEVASRTMGTTVEVTDLFANLPVRLIDLTKNIKREYHKVLDFLQCYALVCTGVRIVVHQTDARGRKSIMLSTTGAKDLRNNVLSVFGSNGMYGLETVDLDLTVPAKFNRDEMLLHITGYVSNASFGQGRSAADRQYWFINGRPVLLPKFSKAINATYKKFNHLQSPVIILNVELDLRFVDINVTPDKRTVLLNNEPVILESIREEFDGLFSKHDVKIPKNESATQQVNSRQHTLEKFTLAGSPKKRKREVKPEEFVVGSSDREDDEFDPDQEEDQEDSEDEDEDEDKDEEGQDNQYEEDEGREDRDEEEEEDQKELVKSSHENDQVELLPVEVVETVESEAATPESAEPSSEPSEESEHVLPVQIEAPEMHCCHHRSYDYVYHPPETGETSASSLDGLFETRGLEQNVEVTSSQLKLKRRKLDEASGPAKVDDVADSNAENLLTLTVSKDDFLLMDIVGQFNHGFILVTNKKDNGRVDLFIVDQHASDEKYNFERLQAETSFENQPLVVPETLDLNAIDEMIVVAHKDIFAKNGFKLKVNQTSEPGSRVQLVALPYSKNTVFDMADFNELVNLIRETDGDKNVRPSKVRAMFAMRACRSSIMIGRPLNKKTMVTVIRHLSGLDKPWNCPHGRPTMRHLAELQGWTTFTDDLK